MKGIGVILIGFGSVLLVLGLIFLVAERWNWLGRLPGDIRWEGRRVTFYAPLATCLVLSLLATIVLNIIFRLFWRSPR